MNVFRFLRPKTPIIIIIIIIICSCLLIPIILLTHVHSDAWLSFPFSRYPTLELANCIMAMTARRKPYIRQSGALTLFHYRPPAGLRPRGGSCAAAGAHTLAQSERRCVRARFSGNTRLRRAVALSLLCHCRAVGGWCFVES